MPQLLLAPPFRSRAPKSDKGSSERLTGGRGDTAGQEKINKTTGF